MPELHFCEKNTDACMCTYERCMGIVPYRFLSKFSIFIEKDIRLFQL